MIKITHPVSLLVLLLAVLACAIFWKRQILSERGPTWRGVTVGVSTMEDVIEFLGQPDVIEPRLLGSVYIYQEGSYAARAHRIGIKQGVVQQIEEDVLSYSEDILLVDLVERYGAPDIVEWSREGPGDRIVVFSEAGVIANTVALPIDESYATKIIYFRPRSRLRIMIDFQRWLSPFDPFPNSDIVGPKDPWFGTSETCRLVCSHS